MARGNKTSGRRGVNYAKANVQDNFEKDNSFKYKTEVGKSETGANQSTQRMSNGPAGGRAQGEMATLAEQDSKKSANYEISK